MRKYIGMLLGIVVGAGACYMYMKNKEDVYEEYTDEAEDLVEACQQSEIQYNVVDGVKDLSPKKVADKIEKKQRFEDISVYEIKEPEFDIDNGFDKIELVLDVFNYELTEGNESVNELLGDDDFKRIIDVFIDDEHSDCIYIRHEDLTIDYMLEKKETAIHRQYNAAFDEEKRKIIAERGEKNVTN